MLLFAFPSSFKHNTFIIQEKEQKNFSPCNDPNDLLPAIFHGRFGIQRFWFFRKPDNRRFTLLFLILFDASRIHIFGQRLAFCHIDARRITDICALLLLLFFG